MYIRIKKAILLALKEFFFNLLLSNGTVEYWNETTERVLVIDQLIIFPDGQQGHLNRYLEDITLD